MGRSLIETIMGAVVLALAGLFILFVYEQRNVSTGEGYQVNAKFEDVSGIAAGSDVRIGGIKVGKVIALALEQNTYRPVVSLHLKPDVQLPVDSSAAIVSESLLGGKYVELSPGGMDEMLRPGGEITITASSVNLEQMIGKFMFSGGGVGQGGKDPQPADTQSQPANAPSFLE